MINIAKYLRQILDEQKPQAMEAAHVITRYLVILLLKDKTILGARMLHQGELARQLGVPIRVIKEVWRISKYEFGIIDAKPKVGTYLIRVISEEKRNEINTLLKKGTEPIPLIRMDRTIVHGHVESFDRQIKLASNQYLSLQEGVKNLAVIPVLISLFAKVISSVLDYEFFDTEMYYTDDYSELITSTCASFCSPGTTVIVLVPISTDVYKAMQASNRKIRIIEHQSIEQKLEELEKFCEKERVELVYVGSSVPLQLLHDDEDDIWRRLRHLQQTKKFKILLDDRHPKIVNIPNLFRGMQPGSNNSIIYITILSNNELLNPVNVIAGPSKEVKKLAKSYARKGIRLPVSLSIAIIKLFNKYENIKHNLHYVTPKSYLMEAKKLLLASGLFDDQYINNHQHHFFYLKLRSGKYPSNIYGLFNEKNIAIMDLEVQRTAPNVRNAFFISFANYTESSAIRDDIDILINYIRSNKK